MAKSKKQKPELSEAEQEAKLQRKKAHKEQLKTINEALEKKIKEKEAAKAAFKAERKQRKQVIEDLDKQIKACRSDHHNAMKKLQESVKDKTDYHKQQSEAQTLYCEQLVALKNERAQVNFDFGKKHQTLWWKISKWTFGLRKEFRHIIWSHPKNTFKYLGIIILIVGIFAILFFAIDNIIKLF